MLSTGIVMGYSAYYPAMTILGWALIGIGVGGFVHGASVTNEKPGPLVGAYTLGGVIAGGVHLYLLGSFDGLTGLFQ